MADSYIVLPYHRPPGDLQDLSPENQKLWSLERISKWMRKEIDGKERDPFGNFRIPLSHFFDGTSTPFNVAGAVPQPVKWNAFPKLVKSKYPDNKTRWDICDYNRMLMDEYLEWSVARSSKKRFPGKKKEQLIDKIAFTCEGPEYWQFIADYEGIEKVWQLYKELNPEAVDKQSSEDDVVLKNDRTKERVYNPMNGYNLRTTNGSIAHLIHPNNTLSAEIDIAAQATVARIDGEGNPITSPDELIACSKYGNPGRNSDPTIGASINSIVLNKQSITIAEPVALYIHEIDTSNLELHYGPNPEDKLTTLPEGIITCVRGDLSKNQGLRLHVQIPREVKAKYGQHVTVSHIFDTKTGEYIMYGSQIADRVTMAVSAYTLPNTKTIDVHECLFEPPKLGDGIGRRT